MPATEKTWRSQTLLHAIFAATGLLLLFATLWMFAKDHDRPWKNYQKKARSIDVQMTELAKIAVQTDDFEAEKRNLEESLSEVARRRARSGRTRKVPARSERRPVDARTRQRLVHGAGSSGRAAGCGQPDRSGGPAGVRPTCRANTIDFRAGRRSPTGRGCPWRGSRGPSGKGGRTG
jgi:hypothetical protein